MRVLLSAIILAMLIMAQNMLPLTIINGQYALIDEFQAYSTINVNPTHHRRARFSRRSSVDIVAAQYLHRIALKSEPGGDDHLHHSYLCAAKKDCPGGGVSRGDKGGGVFVRQMDGTQLVVGVIAQPQDAKKPGDYDLYTNVHSLSSVIEDLQDECGPITAFGIRISAY